MRARCSNCLAGMCRRPSGMCAAPVECVTPPCARGNVSCRVARLSEPPVPPLCRTNVCCCCWLVGCWPLYEPAALCRVPSHPYFGRRGVGKLQRPVLDDVSAAAVRCPAPPLPHLPLPQPSTSRLIQKPATALGVGAASPTWLRAAAIVASTQVTVASVWRGWQ
eukprot:354140-Chlamydomonas_euryale.AAC.5